MNCGDVIASENEVVSSQPELSRALPTLPTPTEKLPFNPAGEKVTLYLGAFQIIAMPFSAGNLPPGFGNGFPSSFPSISSPIKKD